MSSSNRWKSFIIWWSVFREKAQLYPPEGLKQIIDDKIEELKTRRKHDKTLGQ